MTDHQAAESADSNDPTPQRPLGDHLPNPTPLAQIDEEKARDAKQKARRDITDPGGLIYNGVCDLIREWKDRDAYEKPPFSTSQLVVFALLCEERRRSYMSFTEIHAWILESFAHYRSRALRQYIWALRPRSEHDDRYDHSRLSHVVEGLAEALQGYEIPVESRLQRSYDGSYEKPRYYRLSPHAARTCINTLLEPKRKGTFNFLGLPAELQEKIYKMLLVYPKPGLSFGDCGLGDCTRDTVLEVLGSKDSNPRYHDDTPDGGLPFLDGHSQGSTRLGSLSDTLAILRVCKQTHHDALPVFYNNNALHFSDIEHLGKALSHMSDRTMKEIKTLHLGMGFHQSHAVLRTTASSLRHLSPKKLVLNFNYYEYSWLDGICDVVHNPMDVPGDLPAFPPMLSKYKWIDGLEAFVQLARRTESLECDGAGNLRDWMVQEMKDMDELKEADEAEQVEPK